MKNAYGDEVECVTIVEMYYPEPDGTVTRVRMCHGLTLDIVRDYPVIIMGGRVHPKTIVGELK